MTDSEIISMLWERDEKALAALSEKYGGYCSAIAENILENREDAEECVNDTYLKVWEKIPPEKPKIFSAFIAKIARNAAIDRYRANHAQKRCSGNAELIFEELDSVISGVHNAEDFAARREMINTINRFLRRLPAKKRLAFVLRYCCCESVSSIAGRLGMNENNVAVMLSRTRNALHEQFKKEGYNL